MYLQSMRLQRGDTTTYRANSHQLRKARVEREDRLGTPFTYFVLISAPRDARIAFLAVESMPVVMYGDMQNLPTGKSTKRIQAM